VLGQEPLDRRAQSGSHVLSGTQSVVMSRRSDFTRSRVMSASAPLTHLDDRGLLCATASWKGQHVGVRDGVNFSPRKSRAPTSSRRNNSAVISAADRFSLMYSARSRVCGCDADRLASVGSNAS
jgi:hypothetical protein